MLKLFGPLSLSQESAKANPRVPTTKPPVVVSKKFIVYVMGDVHSPMGVGGPTTVLKILAMAEGLNPTAQLAQGQDHPERRKWPH